ncbi:hypothetical protein VP01_11191g1, partial [Puccinia sorghi]
MPKKASPKPTKPTTKKPAIQTKENPRKTEVKIHLKMILLIKKSNNSFYETGNAPAVGRPAKGKINGFEMMAINLRNKSLKDQPNPLSDEGLIQYLQRQ